MMIMMVMTNTHDDDDDEDDDDNYDHSNDNKNDNNNDSNSNDGSLRATVSGQSVQSSGFRKISPNPALRGAQQPHERKDPNIAYSIRCRVYGRWYVVLV